MATTKAEADSKAKKDKPTKYTAISYHTFIFPFLWAIGKDGTTVDIKDFTKCLPKAWERDKFSEIQNIPEFYAQFRYFNPAARSAIYDHGDDVNGIVRNYRFSHIKYGTSKFKIKNTVTHYGPLGKKTYENAEYELYINAFRLKLYNTGIGLLVYELENHTYDDLTAINRINDWGRRLYMPFVNDGTCPLCAETVTITLDETTAWNSVISGAQYDADKIDLPFFVTNLLTSDNYSITTNIEKANCKTVFYIEPVIGDRMFVACIYQNQKWVPLLKEWKDGDVYAYQHDALHKASDAADNLAKQLYELIFVDGNGTSCLNRQMLRDLLDDHIYARWLEYGTITGITEYSMITATTVLEEPAYTATPFLTEYIEMIFLAIAQRASLLVFERLISDSAQGKQKIIDVQQKYIQFQSQLLLQEITPEQQGIELYDELLESLFIEKESAQIENQIAALFDRKNYENDKNESWILFILAILGVAEAVEIITDWLVPQLCISDWWKLIPTVLLVFAIVLYLRIKKSNTTL